MPLRSSMKEWKPPSIDGVERRTTREDEHYARILTMLEAIEAGRQHVVDELWARIPQYVVETASTSDTTATSISTDPGVAQPILVRSVLWAIEGDTEMDVTLTLGNLVLEAEYPAPLRDILAPLQLILYPSDARTLAWTAGPKRATLVIMGEQLPTYGKIT